MVLASAVEGARRTFALVAKGWSLGTSGSSLLKSTRPLQHTQHSRPISFRWPVQATPDAGSAVLWPRRAVSGCQWNPPVPPRPALAGVLYLLLSEFPVLVRLVDILHDVCSTA